MSLINKTTESVNIKANCEKATFDIREDIKKKTLKRI